MAMTSSGRRTTRTIGMNDARAALTRLPEELEAESGVVSVTRHGRPVLAIMTWDDYEGILETFEILKDPEAMADLRQAIQDLEGGKVRDFEEVAAELGV